jgi:hypothetical protein
MFYESIASSNIDYYFIIIVLSIDSLGLGKKRNILYHCLLNLKDRLTIDMKKTI